MAQLEKRLRAILAGAGKKPMGRRELTRLAKVKHQEDDACREILTEMTRSGELVENQRGFSLAKNIKAQPATIVKVKPNFGFARPDGAERDVFVPGSRLMGALPGDRVMVRISKSDGDLDAGEVLSIAERAEYVLSGTVRQNTAGEWELLPDDNSYTTMQLENGSDLHSGDKVTARIERGGESHRDHRAVILSAFGSGEMAKNCCNAILEASGIRRDFPDEVLSAAERLAADEPNHAELSTRLDLREACIFTIDSADTKDIDDAVSLAKTDCGWALGVHIADVSHYVTAKSPLDVEAFERGTSVYFADSVIPMLPPALSNGACSLNPGEDRLTFSALMELSDNGELVKCEFRKTIIRSCLKGVYSEINALFDGTALPETKKRYEQVTESLMLMRELSVRLGRLRAGRGALALSSVESNIEIDAEGWVANITPRVQGESERLIEELMLTANEAAATLALSRGLPFVYRVHEPPAPEKLTALRELLQAVGLPSVGVQPGVAPGELGKLLRAANEMKSGPVVNSAMLRAMQKARYNSENLGHYGLALANYTHFTSPIRRYPDLAIHRILSAFVTGDSPEVCNRRFSAFAEAVSKRASDTEVCAAGVERSCQDCYKAEYMHRHLGESFEGIITAVLAHGIYVMLKNTIEGLVRTEALGDGMVYDGHMQYARADGTNRLGVGDVVRVTVAAADAATGHVDFMLCKDDKPSTKD
ncbi:MAG: VacB/RNase II family 3'-5' exoribonuclease [Oscillospiraceae bacterium]